MNELDINELENMDIVQLLKMLEQGIFEEIVISQLGLIAIASEVMQRVIHTSF